MMRRENGRVLVELSLADADKLCKLPLEVRGILTKLLADRSVFEFSEEQFQSLLLALGVATGSAMKNDEPMLARAWLRLANAVNEGNPDWTPYEVDEPSPHETGVKVE